MRRPPRPVTVAVRLGSWAQPYAVGTVLAAVLLVVYRAALSAWPEDQARALAFASLLASQPVLLLSMRSPDRPLWSSPGPWTATLTIVLAVIIVATISAVYISALAHLLHLEPFPAPWSAAVVAVAASTAWSEPLKHRRSRNHAAELDQPHLVEADAQRSRTSHSMDGPVVTAARNALDVADVELILPFVHADGEVEVREAFDRAVKVRSLGVEAGELADRWFFETVVRVHRAGEGAPFTGLKPAGLDVGPVIPAAERALQNESAGELVDVLCQTVRTQVEQRHEGAMALKAHASGSVVAARAYVEAMLGLQVWAHGLYKQALGDPHAHSPAAGHS